VLCSIIDEQDEFERQINELKEKTTVKDSELCQLRNELAEMKKSAQASTVSKLNSSTLTRFTSPFPPEFYWKWKWKWSLMVIP